MKIYPANPKIRVIGMLIFFYSLPIALIIYTDLIRHVQ